MNRRLVSLLFFASVTAFLILVSYSHEFSKPTMVFGVGEVRRPRGLKIERGQEMTVLKAIALAEGTNLYADLDRAKLLRGHREIPLKDILAGKAPDVHVEAQDLIWVPTSVAIKRPPLRLWDTPPSDPLRPTSPG